MAQEVSDDIANGMSNLRWTDETSLVAVVSMIRLFGFPNKLNSSPGGRAKWDDPRQLGRAGLHSVTIYDKPTLSWNERKKRMEGIHCKTIVKYELLPSCYLEILALPFSLSYVKDFKKLICMGPSFEVCTAILSSVTSMRGCLSDAGWAVLVTEIATKVEAAMNDYTNNEKSLMLNVASQEGNPVHIKSLPSPQ